MTTIIRITIAAGNFETIEDAHRYADACRAIIARDYADADTQITVFERQTNGSRTSVVIDGDEDEAAAEAINCEAERNL